MYKVFSMNFNKRIFGFTLAEILITLGIIGVIAGMTIPILMNNYLKNQTVTKLQKAYTTLSQAIKLSEVDNGPTNTWQYPQTANDSSSLIIWFDTYLKPYIKYTNLISDAGGNVRIFLQDGTDLRFHLFNVGDMIYIYVVLDQHTFTGGKNYFLYSLYPNITNGKAFVPYNYYSGSNDGTRTFWKDDNTHGCKGNPSNIARAYCSGLIMYDGWQIKSDYPYFN